MLLQSDKKKKLKNKNKTRKKQVTVTNLLTDNLQLKHWEY